MSKQKDGRDQIGDAQDGLQNRNEGINPTQLDARERSDNRSRDDQEDGGADGHRLFLLGWGLVGKNQGKNLLFILNRVSGWAIW